MEVTKRIRVRCYTMKEARFIMHFLVKNGFEGVTNDSYRDCDLFAWSAFDSDGVCFVGIALSRGASMRVSNLHDSVARKDYVEVSKSKFISEVTKFTQLLHPAKFKNPSQEYFKAENFDTLDGRVEII